MKFGILTLTLALVDISVVSAWPNIFGLFKRDGCGSPDVNVAYEYLSVYSYTDYCTSLLGITATTTTKIQSTTTTDVSSVTEDTTKVISYTTPTTTTTETTTTTTSTSTSFVTDHSVTTKTTSAVSTTIFTTTPSTKISVVTTLTTVTSFTLPGGNDPQKAKRSAIAQPPASLISAFGTPKVKQACRCLVSSTTQTISTTTTTTTSTTATVSTSTATSSDAIATSTTTTTKISTTTAPAVTTDTISTTTSTTTTSTTTTTTTTDTIIPTTTTTTTSVVVIPTPYPAAALNACQNPPPQDLTLLLNSDFPDNPGFRASAELCCLNCWTRLNCAGWNAVNGFCYEIITDDGYTGAITGTSAQCPAGIAKEHSSPPDGAFYGVAGPCAAP